MLVIESKLNGKTITGAGFSLEIVDRWKSCIKEAWRVCGWHIYERFIEKHFTKVGADEYRTENVAYGEVAADDTYRPRSGEGETGRAFWASYNGRKQKNLGHQLAMVFSGATREGAKRATIYPTSNGVRVALSGLVHLNYYKPQTKKYGPYAGSDQINLRGDMLAISRREADELQNLFESTALKKWGAGFPA